MRSVQSKFHVINLRIIIHIYASEIFFCGSWVLQKKPKYLILLVLLRNFDEIEFCGIRKSGGRNEVIELVCSSWNRKLGFGTQISLEIFGVGGFMLFSLDGIVGFCSHLDFCSNIFLFK